MLQGRFQKVRRAVRGYPFSSTTLCPSSIGPVTRACLRWAFFILYKSISNQFEYFPSGTREAAWTFHLSAIGRSRILPGESYPPPNHPEDRAFTWDRGRILNTLQLVYISEGSGELEGSALRHAISAGDAFVLLPGAWHRYRPNSATGWTEHWLEMRGPAVDSWLSGGLVEMGPVSMCKDQAFQSEFERLHTTAGSPQLLPSGSRSLPVPPKPKPGTMT